MDEHKMPAMIPGIGVTDAKKSFEFFDKLGFHKLFSMEAPNGELMHGHVARGDVHFMVWPAMGQPIGGAGVTFYINLGQEDLDAYFRQVRDQGVKIADEPEDQFWGDRTFGVNHPDGYRFTFAKTVKQLTPEEIGAAAQQAMATAK